jgi:hypothetical protein
VNAPLLLLWPAELLWAKVMCWWQMKPKAQMQVGVAMPKGWFLAQETSVRPMASAMIPKSAQPHVVQTNCDEKSVGLVAVQIQTRNATVW